jgi:hypothetical protein
MKSQLLKKITKCQLYKTIILPAVLCGSESWTSSKAHEALLGGFGRNVLRRIYGAALLGGFGRNVLRRIYGAVQIDGVRRRRYNKELRSLFDDVIIKRIK